MESRGASREMWTLLAPVGHAVSIDTNGGVIASCYLDPWGRDAASAARFLDQESDGLRFATGYQHVIQDCFKALYAGRPVPVEQAFPG